MRRFNVTGLCVPDQDYMVDISNKVSQIMVMVERGDYFTINRARQYGKTTTLWLLEESLKKNCTVIAISFEGVDDGMFENPQAFSQGLLYQCAKYFKDRNLPGAEVWTDSSVTDFDLLNAFLTKTCQDKKIILMIDEVDKSSNNLIFLKFLGMLRDKYLLAKRGAGATFQSVILAGVYDIKNDPHSPWNIAADFEIDMSFSAPEIATMLAEYEKDHHTGMDIEAISKEIRAYTSGYPYLVSRLCQTIDEKLNKNWTLTGVQNAISMLLIDNNTLFDDLGKNLNSNKELYNLIYNIIMCGEQHAYNPLDNTAGIGITFGFLKREGNFVVIGNRIFEILIANYFVIKEKNADMPQDISIGIAENGKFNMEFCIKKFSQHYYELHNKRDSKFLERECRLLFLTYLRPLINGTGFYHIESETRNLRRTDLIIDYGPEQFIVELKLWYGESAHEKALGQVCKYLDSKGKDSGYLLTFDFRKEENVGKPRMEWVEYNGKRIFDVMVGV